MTVEQLAPNSPALLGQDEIDWLEEHVRWRLSGRVRDLSLVPHGTGLVLRGHARTYYAKQLAQHAVMEKTDWPILANEIEVR
jgi:hypothetical protein